MPKRIDPTLFKIEFESKSQLQVKVLTPNLIIRSVQPEDEQECIALFGDARVMEKFATGATRDKEVSNARLICWLDSWKKHDPFTVYSILEKSTDAFIGVIAVSHSAPGESEISYLLHHQHWGKGFGSETMAAVHQCLIPRLMMKSYEIEYKPLTKLVATARLDNPASVHLLCGVGFNKEAQIEKYGAPRILFGLSAKQVKNRYHHFFDQKDKALQVQLFNKNLDIGADITAAEMAASKFGHQCYKMQK